MRNSRVFVATEGAAIVATLRLATKKPWAIDTGYFTKCYGPLYLYGDGGRTREATPGYRPQMSGGKPAALPGHGPVMRFASTRTTPTREAVPFISATAMPKGAASPIATRH